MNRLTSAALIALAASSALTAPSLARTDATGEAVSTTVSSPVIRSSPGAATLASERSAAEPAGLVRVATKYKRKRKSARTRVRRFQPTQDMAQSGGNGANAKALLDCSIQSHPDCQPNPIFNYGSDFSP